MHYSAPHSLYVYAGGRWQAQIQVPGKVQMTIGVYDDEVTAARAYDRVALLHGLEERMNFPPEGVKSVPVPVAAPRGSSQYRGVCYHKQSGECPLLISLLQLQSCIPSRGLRPA